MLGRNIGILVLRRSAAAAQRGAGRCDAIVTLTMCLRVSETAAHVWCVRQTVRGESLRSNRSVRMRSWEAGTWLGMVLVLGSLGGVAIAIMFARCLRCLYTVARLDHVGLEGDGSRTAVQFEEEPAGVAEDGTRLIASPEWGCRCRAILAYRLRSCLLADSLIEGSSRVIAFGKVSITQSIWAITREMRGGALTGPFCCPPAVAAGAYCGWLMVSGEGEGLLLCSLL